MGKVGCAVVTGAFGLKNIRKKEMPKKVARIFCG